MGSYWIVLAGALAAGPGNAAQSTADAAPAISQRYTAAQLRTAIHDALRREAISRGAARESALRRLLAFYSGLEEDAQLGEDERRELRSQLRNRLARSSRALKNQRLDTESAGSNRTPAAAAKITSMPREDATILAQRPQLPPPPARLQSVPALAQPNGQELIDLIQKTIAPSTWDVHGGEGAIRYFENKQVLVIRQTDEVHGHLEDLIRALRDE